jgi:hypothetical protein
MGHCTPRGFTTVQYRSVTLTSDQLMSRGLPARFRPRSTGMQQLVSQMIVDPHGSLCQQDTKKRVNG